MGGLAGLRVVSSFAANVIRNLQKRDKLILFLKKSPPVSENSFLNIEFSTRPNKIKERYKTTLSC